MRLTPSRSIAWVHGGYERIERLAIFRDTRHGIAEPFWWLSPDRHVSPLSSPGHRIWCLCQGKQKIPVREKHVVDPVRLTFLHGDTDLLTHYYLPLASNMGELGRDCVSCWSLIPHERLVAFPVTIAWKDHEAMVPMAYISVTWCNNRPSSMVDDLSRTLLKCCIPRYHGSGRLTCECSFLWSSSSHLYQGAVVIRKRSQASERHRTFSVCFWPAFLLLPCRPMCAWPYKGTFFTRCFSSI